MNKWQRAVLVAGALAIAFVCLRPPWEYVLVKVLTRPGPHKWAMYPPSARTFEDGVSTWYPQIDSTRLLAECAAVLALTSIAFVAAGFLKRKRDVSDAVRDAVAQNPVAQSVQDNMDQQREALRRRARAKTLRAVLLFPVRAVITIVCCSPFFVAWPVVENVFGLDLSAVCGWGSGLGALALGLLGTAAFAGGACLAFWIMGRLGIAPEF